MTRFDQRARASRRGTTGAPMRLRKAVPTAVLAAMSAMGTHGPVLAEGSAEVLGEVVITTRNRKEAAQKVPVAVSVITSKELRQDNSETFTDFSRKLPSLSMVQNQPRQSSAAIRGVGKNNAGEQYEGSVGVIVDGIYYAHPGANWGNFIDLDRVEIARGPQGTLLGKNTTMGVINISTLLPSFEPSAEYSLGYGERETVSATGMATGPVADGVLAYRATLGYQEGNGPIDNVFRPGETLNDLNRVNARFQLLATPAENLTARVIVDVNRSSEYNGAWPINLADPATYSNGKVRATNASPTYTVRANRFAGFPATVAWNSYDTYAANDNAPLINQSDGASAQVDWGLGDGYTLTSITGLRHYLFQPHNDYDILNGSGNETFYGGKVDSKWWSQELRLSSPIGGAVDYQTGLYYLDVEHRLTNTPGSTYGTDNGKFLATTTQYNLLNATAIGRELLTDSLNGGQAYSLQVPSYQSLGIYGQLNWHLSEQWTLTLGARGTREDRQNSYEANSNADSLKALTAENYPGSTANQRASAQAIRDKFLFPVAYNSGTLSQDAPALLINPSFKPSEDVLFYASASYGEKSGAIQFDTTTGAQLPDVKPERAFDIALGVKSRLFERKLRLNLNLFRTQIDDYQTKIRVSYDGGVTYSTPFANANQVLTQGVELDSAYAPNGNWTFTAVGAYNPARFESWPNGVCPADTDTSVNGGTPVCDNTGKSLPGASDFSMAVGGDYRAPIGRGLRWHAFASYIYRSEYNASPTLAVYGEQAAFGLLDGGLGFGPEDGRWELSLLGRNLLDEQYLISVQDFSGTTQFRGAAGAPRFIGLLFRAYL
jgi:iron complex outermembrane recepter protein